MLRNDSFETIAAVLGHEDPDFQRTLITLETTYPTTKPSSNPILESNGVFSATARDANLHLPIIDASYGAQEMSSDGSKVLLTSFGITGLSSLERTLYDHGIGVDVDDTTVTLNGLSSIILSSERAKTFDVCEASVPTHSHVYIQKLFSNRDHTNLINGLHEAGVISSRFRELTEKYGAGFARTPWTTRHPDEIKPSH